MNTPLLEGIAKAIWEATYPSPWKASPWKDASDLLRQGTLRQAQAAMEVMKAPLLAIESAKACTIAAAKLAAALEDEEQHTADKDATCEVCAALGELHAAFDAMADDTKAMHEARAKLEKEAKQ